MLQRAARRGRRASSTSRTACTRSRRWPTSARCSATAATSRPSPRARARGDEIVQLMIGRDVDAPVSRPSPRAPRRRQPALDAREPVLGATELQRHLARRRRAARSSASAASTARASASCCSRCSACCAASTGDGHASTADAGAAPEPAGSAKSARLGIALIPEDRKTEGLMLPMSIARQPARSPRCSRLRSGPCHRPRARSAPRSSEMVARLQIKVGDLDDAVAHPLGRQPAEGGDRQVADDRARASSCSTIRPAASTSAPSRRSTGCCATSPTQGTAILFYSTDYDELIGCCDRVADPLRRPHRARARRATRLHRDATSSPAPSTCRSTPRCRAESRR